MPIEIRELVIKVSVEDEATAKNSKGGTAYPNGINPSEQLINICVEKVFEILKEKKDR